TSPPSRAALVAIATNAVARPEWFTYLVGTLAATLTPMALAAVGYSLRFDKIRGRLAPLGVGLGCRHVVAPLAILLMYVVLGQAGHPVAKIAVLEAAMPPMLGASMIAMDHELEPDLVASLIGIGVPLSILT